MRKAGQTKYLTRIRNRTCSIREQNHVVIIAPRRGNWIASSLILIMVMKIASVLQNLLWQRLPGTLGIARDSPLWIIGVLTLTVLRWGWLSVSAVVMPTRSRLNRLSAHRFRPSALPGLIVALISVLLAASAGAGTSDHNRQYRPAVAIGARLLPRVNRMEWTILASCRNHRRAVWHTCCGGTDIFANLKWQ